MSTISSISRIFSSMVFLILIQVSFLFACQLFETRVLEPASPSPTVLSAILQPTTTLTPAPPTLASSVPVTLTATLIPTAIPLSPPATPYPEEWLAFVDQKTWEPNDRIDTLISFVRQDGSGLLQPEMFEKFYSMVEYSLAWSPNGQYLLFDWSNFGLTMTRIPVIHIADPLRRKVTLVDSNNAWVLPSWSPDSEWFVASVLTTVTNDEAKEQYTYNLFRVNLKTFQRDRITNSTSSDLYPSWSPDGKWIAFLRYTPESMMPKPGTGTECGRIPDPSDFYTGCIYADLYVIQRHGGDPVLLLKSVHIHMDRYRRDSVYNNPAWSPDSKWLAVLTGTEQPDITLINIETGETRVLAPHPALDIYATWSPDGSKLAFVSNREGNEEIYLISRDGSFLVNLTNNAGSDFNPVWSPSGRYLAFLSDREELRYKLYVMNSDGTDQHKVYDDLVFTRPSWFPLSGVDLRKFFGFGSE